MMEFGQSGRGRGDKTTLAAPEETTTVRSR